MELSSQVNREPPAALPGRQMPHLERYLHNPQLVIWAGSILSPSRICLIMGWLRARREDREKNEAAHTAQPSHRVSSQIVGRHPGAAVSGGAVGRSRGPAQARQEGDPSLRAGLRGLGRGLPRCCSVWALREMCCKSLVKH